MAKYKVGDKVRVKDYPVNVGPTWVHSMNKFCGKIVTIKGITQDGFYAIKESCYVFCDDMFEGLSTGNEVIDLLMRKLDVEIDEEFEIEDSLLNPYRIRKNGDLVSRDGERSWLRLAELVLGECTIKKIPKPEIKEMTVAELEEALKLPKGTLRVKGDD